MSAWNPAEVSFRGIFLTSEERFFYKSVCFLVLADESAFFRILQQLT